MKYKVTRKNIVIIALIFVGVVLLGIATLIFLPKIIASAQKTEKNIYYYPASYSDNIFENSVYLGMNRELVFGTSYEVQGFTDADRENVSDECRFFLDYFHAVVNGDYESYQNYFVDGYFEDDPKFTMQMLYDLNVTLNSTSATEIDGQEVILYNYLVKYKIFQNNGTFRTGVSSDTTLPQIYQLVADDSGGFKIYRILEIEVVDEAS